MNHVTRKLAKQLYESWHDDVSSYASGPCIILSFEDQRGHFMRKAVALKKTREYRKSIAEFGEWPW